jgi:hypothetical protein
MLRLLTIIILFSGALLCASCSSSSPSPTVVDNSDGSLSQTSDTTFPAQPGTTWTYLLYDLDGKVTDTLRVVIGGTTTIEGDKNVRIWEYRYSDRIEIHYVDMIDDTVDFYRLSQRDSTIELETRLVFPLQIDHRWTGPYYKDTSVTVSIDTLSVPIGQLLNTYQINRVYNFLRGPHGHEEIWFKPGIGIVQHQIEMSVQHIPFSENRRLLSISLP